MADIEALMYSYPAQGIPGFTALLSSREELWPSEYDVQRAAAQEVAGSLDEIAAARPESPSIVSGRRSSEVAEPDEIAVPQPTGGDDDIASPVADAADAAELSEENIARHAVRVLCERFMLVFDRLFLYYSTGAGKTVISAGAVEPLVRNVATELVDSYVSPKRTNLRRVIVIVSSEAQKQDFRKKVIETSRRTQYRRAVRIGASQPINERLATYAAALAPVYSFYTKTEFITFIYGTSATTVDTAKPDPTNLAFANNCVILIDEIHSFSREDSVATTAAVIRREEEDEAGEASGIAPEMRQEEDFRYAQYHYILHTIQGSKVIGLSATPMKDSPHEIVKVLNLILPIDRQIPASLDVMSREQLMPYLRGFISYFRTRSTRIMNRGVMMQLQPQSQDFETLFPVAMSVLQAKVYRRVISERDSFNRNALRAGNIVYPDESADVAGFHARFARSTRGWDGMEPTDEYRQYLHASRANREELSPKFCAIADLCRISRGVVFVYMRNLKGGLLDLAAFLDAEGFERFTPQPTTARQTLFIARADGTHDMLINKRPRYSLVIGETKSVPGRLDGILGLSNIEENADGEYVKVILGSAAVRESFDIRNSVTMVIASPEQTETAMIQALGRVVRPGAQRALFRLHPDLPAIVSVYRMASYLPGTAYEGKDVDTYLESSRKDHRIKVVERALRDASVDCRMLHAINFSPQDDVVDGSPACLYGPCDYVCDIEEGTPATTLDSTSMNALYRSEKLLRLKLEIARAAGHRIYIPIADVDAVVESHALAQRVLETMSIVKEQVRDRFGRQAYVYHDRNGVYFASSPVITGLVGDASGAMSPVSMSEYEHYVTTQLVTPLDTLSGTSQLLPGILETIVVVTPQRAVTESIEADRELLRKFAIYIRRELVPKADILEHVRVRGEQRVRGLQGVKIFWVDYSGLLYTRGDLRVYEDDEGISPLIDKTTSGLPLRFISPPPATSSTASDEVAGTWGPPSPVLMRILHHRWRSYMRALFTPYETRFAFYGVIRPSEPHTLRIARRGRDNAKTPGRALPSWSIEDLREVLATLIAGPQTPVTPSHARLAALQLSDAEDIGAFLTREFERRGMLLRL